MTEMALTEKIDAIIAEHGSTRDALNVVMAQLEAAQAHPGAILLSADSRGELVALLEQMATLANAYGNTLQEEYSSDLTPDDHEAMNQARAWVERLKPSADCGLLKLQPWTIHGDHCPECGVRLGAVKEVSDGP